jgi:choline dehydrogenase-like flavoprotein
MTYDAIIIGSGATGGWVAKTLSEAGMKTLVLEAGPRVTEKDFTEHVTAYELKHRGFSPEIARNRPIQAMKYACRESNYQWFVDDIANPYTTPKDKPFQWTRGRILGGRTLTWGRLSWRLGPLDFKPASHDGYGEDWPFSYEDIEPYYDRVERYVGVSGMAEGLSQIPDGEFLPPMAMNCGEKHFEAAVESKLGLPVTVGRPAIITRDHNGRSACHYCGPCEQGCVTHSYFSSLWTTLVDAQKSGNCTIQTGAVCSHITTDPNTGLASGVAYFDSATRSAREVFGKVVVVCASTLESTRLLLNSGEGFCNSSGTLGRYLMDHIAGATSGVIPVKEQHKWSGPPRRPGGIYVPRFLNLDRPHTDGILRGYGLQGSHGSSYDSPGSIAGVPGFGRRFKEAVVNREDCWTFRLTGYAECLPQYDNFVRLDPNVKDAWGVPALHIHAQWGDNEMKLYKHMLDKCEEMLRAAGAQSVTRQGEPRWPGGATHELGTARMGNDPKKSVVNRYRQAHDIKNIFVTDGACFPSSPCQNPTLTMMAMALETSEYIVDQARRGEL